MKTRRLTVAQAVVEFLAQQHTERDGVERRFFPGVFGIFGHGNVAGVGQALQQAGNRLPFYLCRNEQAMVHTAAAYAKMSSRLATLACTTSIGPGATNWSPGRPARRSTACPCCCCRATSSPIAIFHGDQRFRDYEELRDKVASQGPVAIERIAPFRDLRDIVIPMDYLTALL